MAKSKRFTVEDLQKKGLVMVSAGIYQYRNNHKLTGDISISAPPKNIGEKIEIFTTIKIKALSINGAFKGKKFKTKEYDIFQKFVLAYLPQMEVGNKPYELVIEFGLSSRGSDLDNCMKTFIDCLVKKYNFDDRDIYSIIAKKVIVKKTEEYIKFQLKSI